MGCGAILSPLLSSTSSSSSFFFFFFSLLAAASHGADTLKQGQSLRVGETLISQGQVFELGFFTPSGGSTSGQYVGIWYFGLPAKTVVWVANRNDPITGTSGNLTLASNGSLVIFDGSSKQRWTTNTSTASRSAVLQLMDNGNLFLNASDGSGVLWQSFEHPTDTYLPGMKLTLDAGVRSNRLLRSWRSATDPSEGNYSLGLVETGGNAQIFIWKGSVPHWRTGQWVSGKFSGVKVRSLSIYGWSLVPTDGQGRTVITFTIYNASLLRFLLQWDGKENVSILDSNTKVWNSVFLQPTAECDIYNTCGGNARCVDSGSAAACQCLRGFLPRSEAEWGARNWTGGCVRKTQLKCAMNATVGDNMKDDGFWVLSGVNLPDLSEWAVTIGDPAGCRRRCLGNCSCTAYSYVDGGGCMTWSTPLVDVHQISDGSGYDIYVKLAGSELANKDKIWIILLIIALLVVTIILLTCYLCWTNKEKIKGWWKKSRKREVLLFSMGSVGDGQPAFISPDEFVDQTKDEKSSELPLFSFDSIAAATGYFSESNKLGEGGFGHVYKGILSGGREIAVKRLSETSGQGLEEFKNEVILIAKLQHRNLVRLMGCCIQGDEKILIYEYLPNKSLDAFIFNPSRSPLLDWGKRFNIIEGIARGLLYLHRDSRLRIIHRDLKASNILLDEEMNPKISDFGMARIFGGNQNQANTTRLVGTFGYMSPEYAMEGLFSIKSDVYSFGVLTLEIISGQRNNSFHRSANTPNLVGRAWRLWNEDRSLELVDPSIRSSISTREVMRCIQVGLLCVQDRANERPTMSSVVFMLENDAMAHPMPKQPTFTLEGSPTETESLAQSYESCTRGDVTVTVVTGR